MSKEDNNIKCSFCGKLQSQVERIIAGPGVYICNECIDLCSDILYEKEELSQPVAIEGFEQAIPKPAEIMKHLSDYVVGQEDAKKHCQLLYIITIKEHIVTLIWMMLKFRKATFC